MEKNHGLRLLLPAVVYMLIFGALLYYIYISPYNPHPASVEDVRHWVAGFGALAPLIYIGIYTIRPLLLLPALPLNLSAGLLFGSWRGLLFLLAGGLGGACFCYFMGRYGGGRWLLKNFGGSLGHKLNKYLTRKNSFNKILWMRTVPIFPYDPVSIIAGSLKIPLNDYIGATLLGMIPGAIAFIFLADSFNTGNFYVALLVMVLAFGVPLFCWKKCGEDKKIKEEQENHE